MSLQGETRENTKIRIREPKYYKVIMHNDDFTTMEFVVEILKDIFHKDEMEAERLMLMVHECGKAAVGTYPYDLAASQVRSAAARAKAAGFPFRMTVEEA